MFLVRIEGGDNTISISPTDDTAIIFKLKPIAILLSHKTLHYII